MGLSVPLGREFGYLKNLHFDYYWMRWLVSFADHLCLVDRLVVVLDPADLGFAAGLALVELKLVDLGRLVPAGSDLDLAIHFVNFAGPVIDLVGFALADLPVVLDLIDPVRMETALAGLDLDGPAPVVLAQMVIVQMVIDQMVIDLVRPCRPLVLTVLGFGLVQFRLEADQSLFLYLLDLFRHLVP